MTVDEARTETPPEYRGASAAKSSTNGGGMIVVFWVLLVSGTNFEMTVIIILC